MLPEASLGGPSCTYLLILVIAGLRVGLGSGGWWWGVGGRIVGAIAPIVVGRWWWRRRRWGCVALGVASLVVGWLAVTRLSRERDKSSMRDSTHRYRGSFPDRGNCANVPGWSGKQQILDLSSETQGQQDMWHSKPASVYRNISAQPLCAGLSETFNNLVCTKR